jgi:hypothetical protein
MKQALKYTLLLIFVLFGYTNSIIAQRFYQPIGKLRTTKSFGYSSLDPFGDYKEKLTFNLKIGATASFAHGELIDDTKAIYALITEDNAKISGSVTPLIFPTVGLNVRYQPFLYNDESKLWMLHLSLGIEYFRRGFNSSYITDYTFNNKTINDKISYKQSLAFDAITVPLMVRYGDKYFVELGVCFTAAQGASKRQIVDHTQGGTEAFKGGFDVNSKELTKLSKTMVLASSTDPRIAVGFQTRGRFGMEIGATYFTKTLLTGSDFKNILTHCKMTFKLNK